MDVGREQVLEIEGETDKNTESSKNRWIWETTRVLLVEVGRRLTYVSIYL